MTFEARILGPVEATVDGRPVALGSPKQRAVFALLVLHAGRVVSNDRLVAELWGDEPPDTPLSTLQVYISRLRKSLGAPKETSGNAAPAAPVRLLRRGPGYQLDLPEGSVDAGRFATLVSSARTLVAERPPQAQQLLDEALALPRGPALADVVGLLGPTGAAEAKRLDDLWLVAQESRLETLLAQGDAATAAAEAASLVRLHPLQEDLHGALMLALYRAGRQSEALQAFSAVRELLADELGVDPGTALRELHGQILRQDPALDLPPARPEDVSAAAPELPVERHVVVHPRGPGVATGRAPEFLTSFVGREDEVVAVLDALARARLTTLVGTGGSGKTRLALAAVDRVTADRSTEVWWVDVAAVSDPSALARVVAAAVGSHEVSEQTALDAAVSQLAHTTGLLVLDNCEHLVDAVGELVHALLRRCPGLRVLVTTREPLGLPGELVWSVLPLALPEIGASPTAASVGRSAAVRLWCERAGAALGRFDLSDDNAAVVAQLCRRLDGLPLAIELAAARLRVLSLEELADALLRHLEVLVGSERGVAERHRTLRATLDWSYQLLSGPEQQLLAELSVFHGGFTQDALGAVCGPAPAATSHLDLLSGLVDRSLVSIADRGRPTRYRLLETVRLYAADQLGSSDRAAAVRSRHLDYFLALAEQAEPHLSGPAQRGWASRLDAEVANVSAALRWSLGSGAAPVAGLRLAVTLWPFWYLRGHYTAGREWLSRALAAAPEAPPELRARGLAALGRLAYLQCDYPAAADRLGQALRTYESLDDTPGRAAVLQSMGSVARERGDYAQSRALHRDSLERWRELGRPDQAARSLNYLGFAAWLEQDWPAARAHCGAAADHFRTTEDAEGVIWSLIVLGAVACYTGDPLTAAPLLEESRRRSEDTGYREGVAWSLNQLGVVAWRRGDPAAADALLRASLREHWELGDRWRTASVLETLAEVALGGAGHGADPHWVARLLGTADELRTRLQAPVPPVEAPDLERALDGLAATLGAPGLAAAMTAGRLAPLDDTVAELLAGTP